MIIRRELEWLPAAMSLAMGIALQSCVLAAMSGLFALGAFYDRMDRDTEQRPLQCAIRCVFAGVLALVAALVLATLLATHLGGLWNPTAVTAAPAVLILLLSVGVWFARGSRDFGLRPYPALVPWAALAGGFALLVSMASKGPLAQCIFAAVVVGAMIHTGLRLISLAAPMMRG